MGLGLNPPHFMPVRNHDLYFYQLLSFYLKNFQFNREVVRVVVRYIFHVNIA